MYRSSRICFAVAIAMSCCATAVGAEDAVANNAESARHPNIIFIMADDLGYGDLGCYGQKTIPTPNIDRLAAQGMRFTQAYAGSTVCAPSRCVLMTGLHTGHCFIRGNGKDNLRPSDATVAKVLKSAGYTTGMFGKWGLGHEDSTGLPTRQGFDTFYGYLDQHHAHNYYPSFLVRGEKRVPLKNEVPGEGQWGQGVATKKVDYSHDLIMTEALKFVEENYQKPFFLYLPVTIPHANNEAGRKGMEIPDLGQFADKDWPEPQKGLAAMIAHLDGDVGRLMELLRKLKIDDNTIVMFTSDNGPHREGGNNPDYFDSNGPLRGIKRAMYDGGIRVPLVVRWPGHVKAGTTSDHICGFQDLLPTAAALAGAPAPQDTDGVSFLPTLLGKPDQQKQHEYLYWEFYEGTFAQAVRMGKWKGVRKGVDGPIELYDVVADLGEQNDLAQEHPEVVEQIAAAMKSAHTPSDRWQPKRAAR